MGYKYQIPIVKVTPACILIISIISEMCILITYGGMKYDERETVRDGYKSNVALIPSVIGFCSDLVGEMKRLHEHINP